MRWPQFKPVNTTGVLVEVTGRTHGARSLLVPSPKPKPFNELVVGVIGRALEVSPVELCAAVFMVNNYHLLTVVHEQQELSRFMQHLGCNLSKAVGRIRGWSGSMWARRYDGIVVSDDPEAAPEKEPALDRRPEAGVQAEILRRLQEAPRPGEAPAPA